MRPYLATTALAVILSAGGALAQTDGDLAPAPNFVIEQPANEWSASIFLGDKVTNAAGETIGDVNDLLFDKGGRISTAVLGVGGFVGIGEKSVAVPFSSLTFLTGPGGERVVKVQLTKDELMKAPDFKPTEKTTFMKAKEKATEIGTKTMEKAGELRDQAVEKIEGMTKDNPKPKDQ